MEIDIIGLISACSYALDCIEAELVNIKNKHGKRVAYISVRMGQYFDLPEDALQDLAICALLHDNALTQYISEELQEHSAADLTADLVANTTNLHCIYGEQNLAKIPFKTDVTNAILYHHEHAAGGFPHSSFFSLQYSFISVPLPCNARLAASLNFSICLSLHNLNPPAPAEYRI